MTNGEILEPSAEGNAARAAAKGHDWIAWHQAYDDPNSSLSRRLRVIQEFIRKALDDAPPGPIRVVQMCAGDARDLVSVAATHRRGIDLVGRVVELDAELASRAHRSAVKSGLSGLDVVKADAGERSVYEGAIPADLILACGVFGNISDDDISKTVSFLALACRPDARVIWTRGRIPRNDFTPQIRSWFADHGFEELAFVAPNDAIFSVGVHRYVGEAVSVVSIDDRIFSFV